MQLTRRDAVAALAAIGATGGAALGVREWRRRAGDRGRDDLADDRQLRDVSVAVAEVVYPSELEGVPAFVERVLDGRLNRAERASDPDERAERARTATHPAVHVEELRRTVAELDELAEAWQGAPVPELSVEDRDRHLREVGADTAPEDPHGSTAERVRYYVVNELLLALYSSPTGGELVGIENPQGHAGGLDTYQRGPSRE